MIRRVTEGEAERIGRGLRLDVIDPDQREAVVFPEPVECARDDVVASDRIVHEALLACRNPLLPITHVLFEDTAKRMPGNQPREQAVRFVEGPDHVRDR